MSSDGALDDGAFGDSGLGGGFVVCGGGIPVSRATSCFFVQSVKIRNVFRQHLIRR